MAPAFKFHVSSSAAEDVLLSQLALLNDVNAKLVPRLLDAIVDDACGRDIDFGAIELPRLADLRTVYRFFFVQALNKKLPTSLVLTDLATAGVDEALRQPIAECSATRAEELRRALSVTNSANIDAASLQNFDWQVQLVVSSDKVSTLRQPVVALEFTLGRSTGEARDRVVVELPPDDLDALIATLERVSATVAAHKTLS